MTLPGLTLLGTTASSGKSLLTRSLAFLARSTGQAVEIYKPVVMTLQPHPVAGRTVDLSMHLSVLAADYDDPWRAKACSYLAKSVGDGAYLYPVGGLDCAAPVGKLPRLSEDGIDFTELADAMLCDVRARCIAAVHEKTGFLITEGAGGATDAVSHDLSNALIAEYAQRPVVLVAGARRGGVAASLTGTTRLLGEGTRRLVCGFVVNGVTSHTRTRPMVARAEDATGSPCLGIIPLIPCYAQLPDRGCGRPVYDTWSEEIAAVADFVRPFLTDALLALLTAEVDG